MHTLQFLCSEHRQWLRDNPHIAAVKWQKVYSQGLALMQGHNYRVACAYAGAAFEIAGMRLIHDKSAAAIDRLSTSAATLAKLLFIVREPEDARAILAQTVTQLKSLTVRDAYSRQVLESCEMLSQMIAGQQASAATLNHSVIPIAAHSSNAPLLH